MLDLLCLQHLSLSLQVFSSLLLFIFPFFVVFIFQLMRTFPQLFLKYLFLKLLFALI